MLEYAGDLMNQSQINAAIRYQFNGQRADGAMPDRVQANGLAVFGPGGVNNQFADHAIDNMPFAAKLVAAYMDAWPTDSALFCNLEPNIRRAFEFLTLGPNGLVYNDPKSPNCSYGFTDTIGKAGNLLFCSLLTYDAAVRVAWLANRTGCGDPTFYARYAAGIAGGIDTLRDNRTGLYFAADAQCVNHDIWGSMYLVSLGLSSDANRQQVVDWIVANEFLVFKRGQVRHLPYPEAWQASMPGIGLPAFGTYQNGAYWGTPLGWVLPVLNSYGASMLAMQVSSDAMGDYRGLGINECINDDSYTGVPLYVDSGTNFYGAVKSATVSKQPLHERLAFKLHQA
eukprot:TRINITY_DN1685_c0_g1_i2.p1 TRINITY_DN1685_c0_g1~~TRINITY_DN1685_c0_g1_i2.p1  ORF type:complete len:340 (-),score=125.05 TRINITY_DN1685_c0_g1_i2:77-1096(-)